MLTVVFLALERVQMKMRDGHFQEAGSASHRGVSCQIMIILTVDTNIPLFQRNTLTSGWLEGCALKRGTSLGGSHEAKDVVWLWRGRGAEKRWECSLGMLPKHFKVTISTLALTDADKADCIIVQLYLVLLPVGAFHIPTLRTQAGPCDSLWSINRE